MITWASWRRVAATKVASMISCRRIPTMKPPASIQTSDSRLTPSSRHFKSNSSRHMVSLTKADRSWESWEISSTPMTLKMIYKSKMSKVTVIISNWKRWKIKSSSSGKKLKSWERRRIIYKLPQISSMKVWKSTSSVMLSLKREIWRFVPRSRSRKLLTEIYLSRNVSNLSKKNEFSPSLSMCTMRSLSYASTKSIHHEKVSI